MIPNRIATFFNLGDAPEPFKLWHYLCLHSMSVVNRPEDLVVLGAVEPRGEWWQRARRFARFEAVPPVTAIFGNPLDHHAHRADVMRLQWLQRNGGIYLDLDTVCVRPLAPLLRERCVMAKEEGVGLCNAVILSEAHHPFLKAWLEEYRTFCGAWNSHSVIAPWKVARFPEIAPTVTILPQSAFFEPRYDGPDLRDMHVNDRPYPDAYSHHLWNTKAAAFLDSYTPESVMAGTSTFCRLTRPFLPCPSFRRRP
jgi:hypothetical protein